MGYRLNGKRVYKVKGKGKKSKRKTYSSKSAALKAQRRKRR